MELSWNLVVWILIKLPSICNDEETAYASFYALTINAEFYGLGSPDSRLETNKIKNFINV